MSDTNLLETDFTYQVLGFKDRYADSLETLLIKAKNNTRKRDFEPLGNEERNGEKYFRMLNAFSKDSYAQPHFHPNEDCVESFRSLKGKAKVVFFDNAGEIEDIQELDDETENEIQIPPGKIHTIVADEDCVLYEEMKQPSDGYQPIRDKKEVGWAPPELENARISTSGEKYLEELKAKIVAFKGSL